MRAAGKCLVALLSFLALGSAARAYEVLDLRSHEPRVAVIVLAYEDQWTSYAGEALFDGYLHALMAKRYSRLYVTRGKNLTVGEIQDAFKAALGTAMTVDFMTCSHSDDSSIRLHEGQWVRPEDVLSPLVGGAAQGQLEMAANFGCYSDGQTDQFERLGFKTYVAHEGISVGAVAMNSFLYRWLTKCQDLQTAVDQTNGHLQRMFSRNAIAKAIFRKLSGEQEYTAVMKAFGQNLDLCR